MPEQVSYPEDLNAELESNFIHDELHTITAVNAAPCRILIPKLAPFYVNNFSMKHIDSLGVEHPLTEGVDYYFALPYIAATRSTGKQVYGGIPVITTRTSGVISLDYRIIGGPWCANIDLVYLQLLETVFNPRVTWWDKLTNVQALFPPTDHGQSLDDVQGIETLYSHFLAIRDAILQAPQLAPAQYIAHLISHGNPHGTTLEDLGAKEAAKLELATDEEVMLRRSVEKAVTLRQILQLLG